MQVEPDGGGERVQRGSKAASGAASNDGQWGLVNAELLRLAHRRLSREPRAVSYDTQELVQETYEKLIHQRAPFLGPEHICGTARVVMDRLLIDRARRKRRLKRQVTLASLHEQVAAAAHAERGGMDEVAVMGAVLERLRALDERQARVVELRFLAGLSTGATAALLGVTRRTVERDWVYARCWLRRELDRMETD